MLTRLVLHTTNAAVHNVRIMNIATALSEGGFDVTIIARGKGMEQEPRVQISPTLKIEYVFLRSSALPSAIPFQLVKGMELNLRALKKSWSVNADVYQARGLHTLPLMWLVSKMRSSLLVLDAPELDLDRAHVQFLRLWRLVQPWLLRSTDLVFAANEERAEIMRDEYGAWALPFVIHNYPSFQLIEGSDTLMQYAHDQGRYWKYIVLHQGPVRVDRAPAEMIRALKFVSQDAGVVFLGSIAEEYKEELLLLAASEGVAQRVLFHPAVSLDVLSSYTASASLGLTLYLNTSRNNYYCAPTKMYEYLMAGVPVVGSAFPGLYRVIEGNQVGAVADPQDPIALAGAINHLLRDDERRLAMGARARRLARDQWNWEKESVKLIEIYHRRLWSSRRYQAGTKKGTG